MKASRFIFVGLILTLPLGLQAQKDSVKGWEVSTAFLFGSANNVGDAGLMLINNYEYYFHPNISVAAQLAFFHSFVTVSNYPGDPYTWINTFDAFTTGIYLNHTARFNGNRNFVKFSAGPAYFHSVSYDGYLAPYHRAEVDYDFANRLGFGLMLEGGGKISDRLSLGLLLNVDSYYIFGDITVLGVNAHFNLR